MIPPTSVVLPEGKGGGSKIGSCPLVASPPEVAELSRISVLGCAGGLGNALVAADAGDLPLEALLVAFGVAVVADEPLGVVGAGAEASG